MLKIDVILTNPLGLHARPAARFVEIAKQYAETTVTVTKEGRKVDAKSIIGIMSLGAKQGAVLTITAEGPEEKQSVQMLRVFIQQGAGEA